MNTMESNQGNQTGNDARFDLNEIKEGMHICWNVSAQAGFGSTTVISDGSGHLYAKLAKEYTSSDAYLFLGQGEAKVLSDGFKVVVSIPSTTNLKSVVKKQEIRAELNFLIGYSYHICVEDCSDGDYNDICINIVAWISQTGSKMKSLDAESKLLNAKTVYYPKENKNISTTVDEKFATEGFVEETEAGRITNGNGAVVWDMPSYKFIDKQVQHPDTVHPILWAHERLNNKSGLFQVLPRVPKGGKNGQIYQIRTYDLATMTIVRGSETTTKTTTATKTTTTITTNWIVIDPLGGAETAAAAWKCFKKYVETPDPDADPDVERKANLYAILITHSHVDHYKGVLELLKYEDENGEVQMKSIRKTT